MTADFQPPPPGAALDALAELQWDWSGAYLITGTALADRWIAQRRDDGRTLTASSPESLREMIADDYRERPVSREVAP
jgi:hypothetical protein